MNRRQAKKQYKKLYGCSYAGKWRYMAKKKIVKKNADTTAEKLRENIEKWAHGEVRDSIRPIFSAKSCLADLIIAGEIKPKETQKIVTTTEKLAENRKNNKGMHWRRVRRYR